MGDVISRSSSTGSDERYRAVFNSNADAFLVFDTEGRIVDANPKACEVYGYPYEELITLSGREIVDPDYQHLFGMFKETGLGEWFSVESVDVHKDGSRFDVEVHGTRFVEAGTELLLAVVRDISPRKATEKALVDSEGRYRQLVESIEETHFLYRHDVDGLFTYVSPSVSQILGYTPEEFLTHFTQYLTENPINEQAVVHTAGSIAGIKQPPYHVETMGKNGELKWLEVSENPVLGDQGDVVAVQGIARDVTEGKNAQEALFHSEERLRAVFDNAAVGILVAGPGGSITKANSTLTEMLGYDEAKLLGMNMADFAYEGEWGEAERYMDELFEGKRSSFRFEERFRCARGEVFWGRANASIIRGQDGGADYMVCVVEDITAHKNADAMIKEKDKAIRRSYSEVIRAITGDRLVITTPAGVDSRLGAPLDEPFVISDYSQLKEARHLLRHLVQTSLPMTTHIEELISAAGEALANMVKHAGGGIMTICEKDGTVQMLMRDSGPGIDFTVLSRATLMTGFSTKRSLGVGFTIMLDACDRVTLSTYPGETLLLLERSAVKDLSQPWLKLQSPE